MLLLLLLLLPLPHQMRALAVVLALLVLQASASCSNKVKDGAETSVDCGGGVCEACYAKSACLVNKDCRSGSCVKKVHHQLALG